MKTVKDKEYSLHHFTQRMKERHHFNITRSDYDILCSMIAQRDPINIEVQKNDTQETYELFFHSTYMKVVWSQSRQCLTTVLPKESC